MSKVYVFLANGCEEVEALTPVDLLRRAGVEVVTVSVTGSLEVTSSHKVTLLADRKFEDITEEADMLVLPGGMPGTIHLKEYAPLAEMIRSYQAKGKYLAAICAAPTVYGEMGLLEGHKATCYPGMEEGLLGAEHTTEPVCVSGQFITSRGLGTAVDFGLKLIEILISKEKADAIANAIVYKR
jgi:4-methyl-5(b-hydroxyethyl)-thiazole monophosphate biosynthesis